MITLGGNAELELVDSMDPFSEGIIFSVMPPKKSWRNISNLSGGEMVWDIATPHSRLVTKPSKLDPQFPCPRLRSSRVQGILQQTLPLSCGSHHFFQQPTPLYFMDEIDAALDFRNVSIVANYIKDRTKNAQFIIISLRYAHHVHRS